MKLAKVFALFATALSLASCSSLMGSLRKDFDEQDDFAADPVTGGLWSERGMLEAEEQVRGPASSGFRDRARDSWVSAEREMANRRDRVRDAVDDAEGAEDMVTSADTPNLLPSVQRMYRNGARATRDDFIDQTPNEGSLWASDGQTNYYFTKNKVRGVGDIVSITMEQDMIRDISLEMRRTLTDREKEVELALAQDRLKAKALGLPDPDKPEEEGKAAPKPAAPKVPGTELASATEEKEVPEAKLMDIDLSRSLMVKPGETMMAEIVERYPNGNYKLRGVKKIPYKSGSPRMLNLVGIARGQDIGEDDVVTSGKLYEYRLEAAR